MYSGHVISWTIKLHSINYVSIHRCISFGSSDGRNAFYINFACKRQRYCAEQRVRCWSHTALQKTRNIHKQNCLRHIVTVKWQEKIAKQSSRGGLTNTAPGKRWPKRKGTTSVTWQAVECNPRLKRKRRRPNMVGWGHSLKKLRHFGITGNDI